MATFNKGILGGFSGKAGTVIGSNWKGRTVMRSLPGKRTKSASQAQLNQQARFRLMVGFLAGMSDLLALTFKAFSNKVSGYNAALSYNIQNAITGTEPDFAIDFSLAVVSVGTLPNASTVAAIAEAGNKVKFTWLDNSGSGKASATDTAILVAFCPEANRSVYSIGGAFRSGLTHTLDTAVFAGKAVETWIAFIDAEGKLVSDSVYTGSVTLTP